MKTTKQLSIKGLFLPAIALWFLLLSGTAAHADSVTYLFEGAVGEVTGVLFPTLNSGQTMKGNITFDLDAAPLFPGTGFYLDSPITGFNLHIGTFTAMGQGPNGIILANSSPGGIDNITAFVSMSGDTINGTSPTGFDVSLTDPTRNLLSGVNLGNWENGPSEPPSLDSIASNKWRLTFGNGNYVLGSLTSLTAVPLPAAVILFGAGLISLVGLGAGGLRNLRWPQV